MFACYYSFEEAFCFKQQTTYLLSVLSFLQLLLLGFMDSAEQSELCGAHQ